MQAFICSLAGSDVPSIGASVSIPSPDKALVRIGEQAALSLATDADHTQTLLSFALIFSGLCMPILLALVVIVVNITSNDYQ